MDFRLARIYSPKDQLITTREGTCIRNRDYSKKIVSRDSGRKTVELKFTDDNPFLVVKDSFSQDLSRVQDLFGVEYASSPQRRDSARKLSLSTEEYILASGRVNQMRYDPSSTAIRFMWWALNIESSVDERLEDLSKFNDNPIPGLTKRFITLFDQRYEYDYKGSFDSADFITSFSYVDVFEDGTGQLVFEEDRSPYNPFIGYIPVEFGGRPSKLTALDSTKLTEAVISSSRR